MKDKKPFYITTTIPYVNADPHIGFAMELIHADAIARYNRMIGREVFFSTGTDEYGQKIWEASQRAGVGVQEYVDQYSKKFLDLTKYLNISVDNFIRTTSEINIVAAQEMWKRCHEAGDIYKKKYKGLYCVGCEKFLQDKDLVDNKCALHPNQELEIIEEENYFFKLSKYKDKIIDYLSKENSVIPEWRRKEAIETANILEDFSISRDKKRISWGIPIPNDDAQVMYVWFGAFINYISTLGWPKEKELFERFWTNGDNIQVAGKDMVKFQSVMWQGMLLSAGLSQTKTVVYHGFVTGEGGIKMSKSLGNVINPIELIDEYGTDSLRYFLIREISPFEDSPFTKDRFKETYNANLANGLGNLVSRVMKMAEDNIEKLNNEKIEILEAKEISPKFLGHMESFNINKAADLIWEEIGEMDSLIQENQPFKMVKEENTREEGKKIIEDLVGRLYTVARLLNPILPETSAKIKSLIKENKSPETPLFVRK